jgi:hypothetical protein
MKVLGGQQRNAQNSSGHARFSNSCGGKDTLLGDASVPDAESGALRLLDACFKGKAGWKS